MLFENLTQSLPNVYDEYFENLGKIRNLVSEGSLNDGISEDMENCIIFCFIVFFYFC